MEEILIEEGIVVSKENGFAKVAVSLEQNCEECSAKIFCKPNKDDKNILHVENSIGADVGDNVKIEIKGKSILKASFSIYGIPLILLLIGIFLGTFIFSGFKFQELYSVIFAIGLIVIYYVLLYTNQSRHQNQTLPKIVFVKRNH